jgi:hypothetical protein
LWWYLYFTGLGDAQVAALIAAMSGVGIICLAAGVPAVIRVLEAQEQTGRARPPQSQSPGAPVRFT